MTRSEQNISSQGLLRQDSLRAKPRITEQLIMDPVEAPRSRSQRMADVLWNGRKLDFGKLVFGGIAGLFPVSWIIGGNLVAEGEPIGAGLSLLVSAATGAVLSTVATVKIPEALQGGKLKRLVKERGRGSW